MRLFLPGMACFCTAIHAEPVMTPPATTVAAASPLPLRARLDKDTIRAAIAAGKDEEAPAPGRAKPDTLRATPYDGFAKDFAKARLPDCLHSEGLKNQPTFFMTGELALPFILVAKLRGVCR